MSYQLHYFPESGHSYKVALMLALCGQEFQLVWEDFASGVTKNEDWRGQLNRMGELPVLRDGSTTLTQSAAILLHLGTRHGKFAGHDEQTRYEVLRWLFWDAHKLTSYCATHRFVRTFTPSPDAAVLEFLRGRRDAALAVLERHLSDRSFIVDSRPTIADIAIVGYLYYPAKETGYDLPGRYPATGRWLDRVADLAGWKAPYELLPGVRLPQYCGTGSS